MASVPPERVEGQESAMNKMIEIRNPATSEKIAELAVASSNDVAQAVGRARQSQIIWQEKSFRERARFLYRFRDLLLDHQEELAKTLTSESGKTEAEFYGNELFYLCDAVGFWAKHAARYLEPERIRPHLLKTKKVFSFYNPIGVVGIISPWNFPLILTIGEAIPALMAGNAVVMKPSELTPLSALFGVELTKKAGFPPDLLQAVVGSGETGEALVDHVDMISFTGSPETGKKLLRRAAERLIPVTLELGGKDPMIVLKDADVERAVNACVWGSLINSGQVCTSVERVYVEDAIYEEFVNKVVDSVHALRQGPGENEPDLGSMTSAEQVRKVEAQLDDAVKKGARILTGGRLSGSNGLYFPPTVLVNVNHEMEVMKEETFGPIIPIMKVRDWEEALRLANDSRYGLDSSVFTRDQKSGWKLAAKIQAGSVCVNDSMVNFVIPEVPMGGIKDSGFGRRHGAEGIRKYCQQKTVVTDWLGLKREFSWFPASRRKTDRLRRALNFFYRSGWKNKLAALGHRFK